LKPPRSAQPLPRYVRRKPLKSGAWGYFFDLPTWARKAGCQIANEPLGTDYTKAVERAEVVLLPAFDSWCGGGKSSEEMPAVAASGTLDWIFAEYRADRRYTKLGANQKRNHEVGFRMVGGHVLKDGRKLGTVRVTAINTAVIDALYEKLLVIKETDAGGKTVERERRTTVNHAMKSCRRAWNIASRRNPSKLPHVNPFAAMGLKSSNRETPTATLDEMQAFRAKAKELGL